MDSVELSEEDKTQLIKTPKKRHELEEWKKCLMKNEVEEQGACGGLEVASPEEEKEGVEEEEAVAVAGAEHSQDESVQMMSLGSEGQEGNVSGASMTSGKVEEGKAEKKMTQLKEDGSMDDPFYLPSSSKFATKAVPWRVYTPDKEAEPMSDTFRALFFKKDKEKEQNK